MKTILKSAVITSLMLSSAIAFAQVKGGTQIGSGNFNLKCRGDISAVAGEPANLIVEMTTVNGKTSAMVNGASGNQDVKPTEWNIGVSTFTVNIKTAEIDNLNDGEKRITHMLSMVESKEFPGLITISFDLRKTAKVVLYDLDGNSDKNKFGGVVLVEALDASGTLLGRFISGLIPTECK